MRTSRNMIRRALETAITSDTDLMDCMGEGDDYYEKTKGDVDAYRRILAKYFGQRATRKEVSESRGKKISVYEIIEGHQSNITLGPTQKEAK